MGDCGNRVARQIAIRCINILPSARISMKQARVHCTCCGFSAVTVMERIEAHDAGWARHITRRCNLNC